MKTKSMNYLMCQHSVTVLKRNLIVYNFKIRNEFTISSFSTNCYLRGVVKFDVYSYLIKDHI